jgi:DNA-binding MarR family transcriptional regulator
MSRSSKSGSRFCKPRAMLLDSSRISVENDAGCANAFELKKEPTCGELRHEIEVFILTAIRGGVRKRRNKIPFLRFLFKACNFMGLGAFLCHGGADVWVKKKNRLIHDPGRLLILSFLYPVAKLDYLELKKRARFTTGNLSCHLAKLEKAGYVLIQKGFKGKYPITICSMTKKGRDALALYAEMLKQITKVTESPREAE